MRLTSPTSSSSTSNSKLGSKHPITSFRLTRPIHLPPSLPPIFVLPIPFLALLVSYLWFVGKRPDIPEQAQTDDPHQWGYPSWYSRHPSPYDHGMKLSKEDEEICDHPKKVMLFIDLQPNSHDIPQALTVLSSLSSSPRFNVTVISPFSPSWLPEDSTVDNLVRNGCEDVDWIWRIGGLSGPGKACGKAVWIQDGDGADMGSADITLLAKPHDMLRPEASHKALKANQGNHWEMGLLAHALPAITCNLSIISPNVFYPSQRVISPSSIVYFPSPTTSPKEYPRLPWGRQWSIYSPSRKSVPKLRKGEDPFAGVIVGKKKRQSQWARYWMKEEQRLAKAMRHAGICLFEGWDKGVVDDRVVKAMLSGCVVATVPPHTGHDIFAPVILPLSPPTNAAATPIAIPAEQLQQLLHGQYSTADLRRIALRAFMVARHRSIPHARLNSVERIVNIWEEGGRGYHFGDGFRWDCHSGETGGWCG
ncbi:hypothetical protein IAU59_004045 [Kwoniella sp. CBS 9459]